MSFFFSWFVIEVLTSQNFGRKVTGVAFHPTNNLVASCSYDKSVKLWNADSGAELWTVNVVDAVFSVAFSPNGTTLAAGCYDGKVYFVDPTAGEIKSSLTGHRYFLFPNFFRFLFLFVFQSDL